MKNLLLPNIYFFADTSINKCTVVKVVGANNNTDYIDCWHTTQRMIVAVYFQTGLNFHHAAFVNVTIL